MGKEILTFSDTEIKKKKIKNLLPLKSCPSKGRRY